MLPPEQSASCVCFSQPHSTLRYEKELGMDEHYAEVSLLACTLCGQLWLKYLYEMEAFTASGRWYLGAIDEEQASHMTAEGAKVALEAMSWYFYGGSFFGGKSGKTSGKIFLNP